MHSVYIVYILRTSGNTLYIGQTNNLERRLQQHKDKKSKASRYVRAFQSFQLVYIEQYSSRTAAMHREYELKQWSKIKKEKLIANSCYNGKDEIISLPPPDKY